MISISITITTDVEVNQKTAFEYNVPIDLISIFKGYGPLPAVIGIRDQTGAWDAVGQTRKVLLSDGNSTQEKLTSYEHPNYFSYTVSEFSGFLGCLVSSANGEWWFSSISSNKTYIKWSYAFKAKHVYLVLILWFITSILWRNYMIKALKLFKTQVEQNKSPKIINKNSGI